MSKLWFPVLILTFSCLTSFSQQNKNVVSRQDSLIKNLQHQDLRSVDPDLERSNASADTLRKKIEEKTGNLTSAGGKAADSLNSNLTSYNKKLDSLKGGLSRRIDSLKNLNLPAEKYTSLLDSINKVGPAKSAKEAQDRLSSFERSLKQPASTIDNKVNKVNGVLNEKASMLNEAGIKTGGPGKTNLDQSVPGMKLPDSGLNSGLNLPQSVNNPLQQTNTNIPSTGLTSVNKPGSLNMPATSGLKLNTPTIQTPKVDLNKSISELKDGSGKVKTYSQQIRNLKADSATVDKLSKDAESQALKQADMKVLTGGQDQMKQLDGMLEKGKNPEALQQAGKMEVQKMAVNHFAGKEQVLQQAMNKMSSYKKKYAQLASLKDTLRKPPNPMHDKPLIERLVPGLTFQLIPGSVFTMDVNLSLAYKLSDRLTAGTGWVERLSVQNAQVKRTNPVYGIRTFGEFKIGKGFSARADMETINIMIPDPNVGSGPNEVSPRRWQWNAVVGLKKDFTIYKSLRGNVQTCYRIWSNIDQRPAPDRLSFRIGFELQMKKGVVKQ